MTSTSTPVEHLELRVESLERRLFDKIEEAKVQQSLVDSLIVVNEKVRNLTAGRKGPAEKLTEIGNILPRYDEIITNPAIIEHKYDDSVSIESVLSEEPRIRREAELLQEIDENKRVLDDESIRNYSQLAPKLQQLRLINIEQQKDTKRIGVETRKLIETYNEITAVLKTQLSNWDLKLKRLEEERRNGIRKASIEQFD